MTHLSIADKLACPKLSARAKVILVLAQIHLGQSLSVLLDAVLLYVDEADKAFVHELLLGSLRQWWALSRIVESLTANDINDKAVLSAINVGLYQLLYMQKPDYACINATVDALKQLNKVYAAGLANAILRKVAKNQNKYLKKVQKNHSLPNWLAKLIKQDWLPYYESIGQALRHGAPLFLRVNNKFCTVEHYSALLGQQQIAHEVVDVGIGNEQAIRLLDAVKITQLPYFNEGYVSVQDLHAQIGVGIIKECILPKWTNPTKMRLLDACTAPGGKLAHLLEVLHVEQVDAQVQAIDIDDRRLQRVHDNLVRLRLDGVADIMTADATTFGGESAFDVVLLDAPCTATGVVRRHPDIHLLRNECDVAQTVQLQADILQNLWRSVAMGGYLLYITCSLLQAENEQQVMNFLQNTNDAVAVNFELNLPNQFKQSFGYQCLPMSSIDGDGFYYCLLHKYR